MGLKDTLRRLSVGGANNNNKTTYGTDDNNNDPAASTDKNKRKSSKSEERMKMFQDFELSLTDPSPITSELQEPETEAKLKARQRELEAFRKMTDSEKVKWIKFRKGGGTVDSAGRGNWPGERDVFAGGVGFAYAGMGGASWGGFAGAGA